MTAEQFHDALGLLPSDLIQEADAWRTGSRKRVIPWHRYAALAACLILVLGCGAFALSAGRGGSMEKISLREDKTAAQAAPEAPATMADAPAAAEPESGVGDKSDNSLIRDEAAEEAAPTSCAPPVDTAGAQFYFGELSTADEVHLIKTAAALEEWNLGLDAYDEAWFAENDLLLIALPGITSPEGLDISVGQGMDPWHWEIRIENLPEARADCADSLLICIRAQKGHIPKDTEFVLIPQ